MAQSLKALVIGDDVITSEHRGFESDLKKLGRHVQFEKSFVQIACPTIKATSLCVGQRKKATSEKKSVSRKDNGNAGR